MSKCCCVLFSLLLLVAADASYLPSYIVPCSRSDPKLNECALQHGRNAIASIVKGDKRLKLLPLEPLAIPEIFIDTSQLRIHLVNSILYGLSTFDLKNMTMDLKARKIRLEFTTPQLDVVGTYNISGQILILPITGNGKLRTSIYDGKIGYEFNYDLVERDGVKYMDPHAPSVTLEAPRSSYNLENLFNGDKRLGDEMNRFLNENNDVMLNEIGPSIRETISAIAQDIVLKIMSTVSFDELIAP